ncbi:MAG: nitrite reductase [Bacillota bacterium]|nr:nitrite reductase [Bacillota bacterium]
MGHAVFRQQNGLMAVGIVTACGLITPEQLQGVAELAEPLGIAGFKLSTRQTLIAILPEEKVPNLQAEVDKLGLRIGSFGEVVRNVKACCGTSGFCVRSQADAHHLGLRLQDRFMNEPVPKDFKISVAGCQRGCTDPFCADFGCMGNPARVRGGFDVIIGGRGGSRRPRHGQRILESVSPDTVERVLAYVLDRYRELGQPHERLCHTIDRVGLDAFIPPRELVKGEEEAAAGQEGGAPVDMDFLNFAASER